MDALLFDAGISHLADTLRLLEITEEVAECDAEVENRLTTGAFRHLQGERELASADLVPFDLELIG